MIKNYKFSKEVVARLMLILQEAIMLEQDAGQLIENIVLTESNRELDDGKVELTLTNKYVGSLSEETAKAVEDFIGTNVDGKEE